jgi:hypothetical protein
MDPADWDYDFQSGVLVNNGPHTIVLQPGKSIDVSEEIKGDVLYTIPPLKASAIEKLSFRTSVTPKLREIFPGGVNPYGADPHGRVFKKLKACASIISAIKGYPHLRGRQAAAVKQHGPHFLFMKFLAGGTEAGWRDYMPSSARNSTDTYHHLGKEGQDCMQVFCEILEAPATWRCMTDSASATKFVSNCRTNKDIDPFPELMAKCGISEDQVEERERERRNQELQRVNRELERLTARARELENEPL